VLKRRDAILPHRVSIRRDSRNGKALKTSSMPESTCCRHSPPGQACGCGILSLYLTVLPIYAQSHIVRFNRRLSDLAD
jgi:hypothetical protein